MGSTPHLAVLATAFLLVTVPQASAHGDADSLQGSWDLAPGERVSFERPIHWHRAMGHLQADQDIVFMAGDAVVAGPAKRLTINHLVRCCGEVWADYPFSVENRGDAPARVTGDVAFLHDNLAVVAHGAEGDGFGTLILFGLMIGIPAWRARQSLPDAVSDASGWLRASRIVHGAAWGLAAAMALVGMVRFGSGPVVGSLGATAWAPWGLGGFFNTHSLLMLLAMALWGGAYACLAGARRRGVAAGIDGHVFLASPLVVGAAILVELGGLVQPLMLAMLPALAVLADLQGGRLAGATRGRRVTPP